MQFDPFRCIEATFLGLALAIKDDTMLPRTQSYYIFSIFSSLREDRMEGGSLMLRVHDHMGSFLRNFICQTLWSWLYSNRGHD